jgi:TonB-linked SusC/RagA family outer membrane protein
MNQQLKHATMMAVLLLSCAFVFAQQRMVSGAIRDDNNQPLAGATVAVKGTDRATTTNDKGQFSILVSGNESVLKISSVGFVYEEITVGAKNVFNFTLNKDIKSLNEVVVVGYGTQKRVHLTGAVETMKASEVQDLPVSNLGTALAGRMLGLSVSGGTNRPGVPSTFEIRNPVSLAKDGGNTLPLIVIDGVLQTTADGKNDATMFNNLDASEVESISILKDASAAVYGVRGANGVILVTTKRGKNGPPTITYSGSYGINDEAYRTKMMDAYQFAQYINIMNGPYGANATATDKDKFFSPDELQHFKSTNYDWLDQAWKPASNMRHTFNVNGGANKATYFASVSYYTQNGNLSTLDFNKWTFRGGADVNLANGLKTGLQVSGDFADRIKTFNKIGGENDENDYRNLLLTPRYIPEYVDNYPVRIPGSSSLSQYHYYEIQRLNNLSRTKDQLMNVNVYAEYEAPFLKGLKARAAYARNFSYTNGSQVGTTYKLYQFNNTGDNGHIYDSASTMKSGSTFKNGDRLYYSNVNTQYQQFNFNASYDRQFGRHNISALVSAERAEAFSNEQDVWKEQPIATTNGQFGSAFGILDGRTMGSESGTLGYIARANYAYADKYLAELLFRTDASTKFSPENYWGRFYSLSAGWILSNEKFFKSNSVDFLKLRYSTGLLGNDDTRPWQWRQRFTYQGGKGLVLGGNSAVTTGMKMEVSPNRNATWSDNFKNNLGVDARFLHNRLSLTAEGFYNHSTNMLLERTESVPVTVGGSIAAENWGAMNFFGYELELGWNDNVGKDFKYGIVARFGWSDNKVLQGNFPSVLMPWDNQPGQSSDNGVWGYDYLGMFKTQQDVDAYVSKFNIKSAFGTVAANLKPGMLYYRDVRGQYNMTTGTFDSPDGIIDNNDQVQLAKKASNHYGFSTVLRANYRGFGFDAVVTGSFGGWSEIDNAARTPMYNNISRNFQSRPVFWGDIYDPDLNPTGIYPNPNWASVSLSPTSIFWQVSGFRMAMRNATISYSLSKRVADALRISNARLILSAINPITFANPFDYKAPDGTYDTYPMLRTFSLGVNITF